MPDQLAAIQSRNWIEVRELKDKKLFQHLLRSLDIGEAEAIALAVELNADLLLIDERKGRQVAGDLNIEKTGILGVLIRAKEKELILSVKPEMDKLLNETNFRIHSDLYQGILDMVNEGGVL